MSRLTAIIGTLSLAVVPSCTAERERVEQLPPSDTAAPIALQAAGAIDQRREPLEHFDRARTALRARNYLTSAAALRAAAAFLRDERASAEHGTGRALSDPANSLERLAARVSSGIVKSPQELDSVFAVVHVAEADYHTRRAADAWTRRQARRTGEELLYAADHLERAAQDALRDLGGLETAAVDRAREVAPYLSRGTGWAPGEIDRAIEMVMEAVGAYRSQLDSRTR
jgi:hypothetical protein